MQGAQDMALVQLTEDAIDPLDEMLGTDDLCRIGNADEGVIQDLRLRFTRSSVAYHRNFNPAYDAYCKRSGFSDLQLVDFSSLATVPLLPTGVFKRSEDVVATNFGDSPVISTTSSGTLGTVSVVPRDDITLKRFFASVAIGKREVLGVEAFDRQVFSLTPSTKDAPNIWVAYVMAGVGVLYTMHSYVHDNRLDLKRLANDLRNVPEGEGVNIVGPPPLLLDLANYLAETGPVRLGPTSLVIAIGGWKRRQNEVIDRSEFDQRLADAFGFADVSPIRDSYNMVELNTVLFECAHKAKHCPPWITILVRDPRSLAVMPSGESGLLSFLDPTPTSYPGFVLSDDFGTVNRHVECQCGITGDIVVFERRVNRVEARGCALKLQTVGIQPQGS